MVVCDYCKSTDRTTGVSVGTRAWEAGANTPEKLKAMPSLNKDLCFSCRVEFSESLERLNRELELKSHGELTPSQ